MVNKRHAHLSSKFDIVQLYYPNEWRKNTAFLDVKEMRFEWFLCSYRAMDEKTGLYYISVSPNVQFYCVKSGKTLYSRGLSRGEITSSDEPVVRSRLLILSDPYNKKVLCGKYKYLCGCDSTKSILSKECDLIHDTKKLLLGAKFSLSLGFDGVVVQHDCIDDDIDSPDAMVCQNATFVFQDGALENVGATHPARCGVIKYAKRNNSRIRGVINDFPSCSEISTLLKENDCSVVSQILYKIIDVYIRDRTKYEEK